MPWNDLTLQPVVLHYPFAGTNDAKVFNIMFNEFISVTLVGNIF